MKRVESLEVRTFKTKDGKDVFSEWLLGLDSPIRARVRARIERVSMGNFGDCKAVGGVFELKLPYGPGYRIYFGVVRRTIVLLLRGGDKKSQGKDIKLAREYLDVFERSL